MRGTVDVESPPTDIRRQIGRPSVTRVLIVDPIEIARDGLTRLLSEEVDFEVVAETGSAEGVDEIVRVARPDLAIVSVSSSRLDGLSVIRQVKAVSKQTLVVCVGHADRTDQLLPALEAGANGFLVIDTDRAQLLSLLRQAVATGSAIAQDLASQLLLRLAAEGRSARLLPDPLTTRELEILRLMARGDTNREIAHELYVAVGTVKVHVEHVLAKLNTTGRTAAAVRAVELGLIGAEANVEASEVRRPPT